MRFRSLLALGAALGVVVGAVTMFAPSALATGTGPQLDIHVLSPVNGTNTVITGGNPVSVEESVPASSPAALNAYSGYNASFVYSDASLLGGALNFGSINDESTGAGKFWTASLCLAGTPSDFSGSLPSPEQGITISCSSTGAPAALNHTGGLARVDYTTASIAGPTAVHMVEPVEAGAGAGLYAAYTINQADSSIQANTFSCTAPGPAGVQVPANSNANPLCPVISPSPFNSVAINITLPPPDLNITKTANPSSFVAGQPASYTLTVNNPSATTGASSVVVTDNLPAAMTGAVTFSGSGAASCAVSGVSGAWVVTCNVGALAAGGSFTVNVNIAATLGTAGGTQPSNCATVTLAQADPNTNNNTSCATVTIIPPAVAWSKSPTSGNLWLCDTSTPAAAAACAAQSVGQQTNTFKFDEIMTNQGDTHGLGGFSFDIHYDPTQYVAPAVDLSPAIALFANPSAHGATGSARTLDCSITNPQNGLIHVACASTGTFGTGPQWVGQQVMAHVTLTPQANLVQSIRPNKENGDVSWVKDDQVTVTNSCGQPLNDGSITPIPGQPECQGILLQGVGPGGVLTGNPNGGESVQTIRRLEGDINKDCSVTVADMQLEASKFGTSVGSLLYNLFYDVNSPLQRGDGEIDINDVQFVYGRMGSECMGPTIPNQAPQPAP